MQKTANSKKITVYFKADISPLECEGNIYDKNEGCFNIHVKENECIKKQIVIPIDSVLYIEVENKPTLNLIEN